MGTYADVTWVGDLQSEHVLSCTCLLIVCEGCRYRANVLIRNEVRSLSLICLHIMMEFEVHHTPKTIYNWRDHHNDYIYCNQLLYSLAIQQQIGMQIQRTLQTYNYDETWTTHYRSCQMIIIIRTSHQNGSHTCMH